MAPSVTRRCRAGGGSLTLRGIGAERFIVMKMERVRASIDGLLQAIRLSWFDMVVKPLSHEERVADRSVILRYENEALRLLATRDSLAAFGHGRIGDL